MNTEKTSELELQELRKRVEEECNLFIKKNMLQWIEMTYELVGSSKKNFEKYNVPAKFTLEFLPNHSNSEEYREFFEKLLGSGS